MFSILVVTLIIVTEFIVVGALVLGFVAQVNCVFINVYYNGIMQYPDVHIVSVGYGSLVKMVSTDFGQLASSDFLVNCSGTFGRHATFETSSILTMNSCNVYCYTYSACTTNKNILNGCKRRNTLLHVNHFTLFQQNTIACINAFINNELILENLIQSVRKLSFIFNNEQ